MYPYATPPGYQQQPYAPLPQPPAKVSPGVLAGATIWRLAVAASAFTGLGLYLRDDDAIKYFTQQSNLLVGVCFLALAIYPLFVEGRRHEPVSGWARGAVTVYIIVTGFVYATMMSGDYSRPEDLFSHLITPLLVTADWLFVGRNQAALRWWHPLAWLGFPLYYIVFYVSAGKLGQHEYLYEFLNPDKSDFPGTIAGFLVGFAGLGYLLLGLGKVKAAMAAQMRQPSPAGLPSGYMPQQQYYPPNPQQFQAPQSYQPQYPLQQRPPYPQQPPPQQPPYRG